MSLDEQISKLSPLKQAFLKLEALQSKLRAVQQAQREPIAIIGMGCRFPGNVNDPASYWHLLRNGIDAVGEVPATRWDIDAYYDPDPDAAGKMYTRYGGFLAEVDGFDPAFFGIPPREAISMDPQQRLLLEVSWEALENAGLVPATLRNSKTGVFVGSCFSDYLDYCIDAGMPEQIDAYGSLGNFRSVAAGRIAYVLGLQGPTMHLDTACSSSLLAIHLACQSLRAGESNIALAGGVNLMLAPNTTIGFCKLRALAPDGRCKSFDAAADGYARGEGCGIIVLKRLSDAIADQDTILALIQGSAVNHDGPSSGLTVPNEQAQESLIQQALDNAKVAPQAIDYVEAHGTGTFLGDPIEVSALMSVLGRGRQPDQPLLVGSVKTNIGHLEAAAGIAGIMKVVLALQNEKIPPHLHFVNPNPNILWETAPIQIPTELAPWPAGSKPRLAGISSFGMSGTNMHIILAEAPSAPATHPQLERPDHLLTLSATSDAVLKHLAQRYLALGVESAVGSLGDISYTTHIGRSHFAHRLSIVASDLAALQEKLTAYLQGTGAPGVLQAQVAQQHGNPKIAFLFTGQGSQYVEMGRALYATQPTFRTALDRCAALLQPLLGESLVQVLYPERGETASNLPSPAAALIDQTAYTQPALFALEYALAILWQSWGIQPHLLIGHSVGELVAACVAGVFSLEDGIKLIAARGRLMGALPQGGAMVALAATESDVQQAIAAYRNEVSIAAVNGPESVVISGKQATVLMIAEQLAGAGVKTRQLTVSHAFHSPLMEPMLDAFRQVANSITYHKPKLRLVSNLTGKLASDEVTNPDYWVRHVRESVRFDAGVATLRQEGVSIFLEIGPQPVLVGMAQQNERQNSALDEAELYLPSLRAGGPGARSDWQQMLASLGALYGRGIAIDWHGFDRDYVRRKVVLPTYPFQRERYWVASNAHTSPSSAGLPTIGGTGLRPLIDRKMRLPRQQQTIFEKAFSTETLPFLADHYVYGEFVVPGSCHVALALSAAELLLDGAPCEIQDLIFPQALVLTGTDRRTVQLVAEGQPQKGAGRVANFQIISFAEDEAGDGADNEADGQEPLTHATGRIILASPATPARPDLSLSDLQARCTTTILPETLYAAMAENQLTLGPTFQWFSALWGGGAGEALAQLQLPAAIPNTDGYALYPSLIDACFQLVLMALRNDEPEDAERTTLLPFALESMVFYGATTQAEIWCHVSQSSATKWALTIFSTTGAVIARVSGFQLREVPASAIQGMAVRTDWLYAVDWKAQPLARTVTPVAAPDCWLIFGANADTGNGETENADTGSADTGNGETENSTRQGPLAGGLGTRLAATGTPTIYVVPGSAFSLTPIDGAGALQQATIDPSDPLMFRQLLTELAARYGAIGVGYLWGIDQALPGATVPDQTLDLCSGLLHLVQALLATPLRVRLWVVTQACQLHPSGALSDSAIAVEHNQRKALAGHAPSGALWGLGRTVAAEHPQLRCTCIDLNESAREQGVMNLYDEMMAGLPEEMAEAQVLYQGETRHVARFAKWTAATPAEQSQKAMVTDDAAYLISGGLGALGLQVAEQLVADGARTLILSGRRTVMTEEVQPRIQQLQAQGAAIHIVQADISQPSEVARLLATCQAIAPLRGIVHAAGLVDDGLIEQQSRARFATVMAAKVAGTWLLHTLTLDLELDFFVCFSSVSSLLGSPGQSNYAAANAFMDTLMQQRRQAGLPGMSINWGPWSEAGIAAALQTRFRSQGLAMIAPHQGRLLFHYLLQQSAPQIGAIPINWPVFLQQRQDAARFLSGFAHQVPIATDAPQSPPKFLQQWQQTPAKDQRRLLMGHLRTVLATVFGWPNTDQIDAQAGLMALGIDSLMAVELRKHLADSLGCRLPATLLFDYPSLDKMATYLQTEMLRQATPATAGQSTLGQSTLGQSTLASSGERDQLLSTTGQLDGQLDGQPDGQLDEQTLDALIAAELAQLEIELESA